MNDQELKPSLPSLSSSDKLQNLLCVHKTENGGGFKIFNDEGTIKIQLFKPDTMDDTTFQRKCLKITKALDGFDLQVRRVNIVR